MKGLYMIFLQRVQEAQDSTRDEIIPFPTLFRKLCGNFSITKKECWEILFFLRDFRFIEIVPYKGVKINP